MPAPAGRIGAVTDSLAIPGTPPPSARRPDRLADQIATLRRRLEAASGRPGDFLDAMDSLLAFVRDVDDREAWAAVEVRPEFARHRVFFGRCVLRFAWMMESLTHAELMARPFRAGPVGPLIGRQTCGQYARMEELSRMVDFSACRRLVMTGCGKLPACLIYLHDRTSIPDLLGIDTDDDAVAMARAVAARWGLNRLRIERADAAEISYAPFDAIYWDPFATPRRRIMERILRTARPDAVIILREPFGAGTLLLEPVMPILDSRFVVTGESEGFPGRFRLKHYILRLKPAPPIPAGE